MSDVKKDMIIRPQLAGALCVQKNQHCTCFKDHCVKGYDNLHKTGESVFCEAQQQAKVKVEGLWYTSVEEDSGPKLKDYTAADNIWDEYQTSKPWIH